MLHHSIDVSSNVTPRLSALIESVVNNPDGPDTPTLDTVRQFFSDLMPKDFIETEHLHHFDLTDSLLDELTQLIDDYGPDAPAVDFIRANASEGLTRVMEAMVNDDNRENPATLGELRGLLNNGFCAHLVGEGLLDEDEDDVLLAEVDGLIEHFSEEALVENFLRYE